MSIVNCQLSNVKLYKKENKQYWIVVAQTFCRLILNMEWKYKVFLNILMKEMLYELELEAVAESSSGFIETLVAELSESATDLNDVVILR